MPNHGEYSNRHTEDEEPLKEFHGQHFLTSFCLGTVLLDMNEELVPRCDSRVFVDSPWNSGADCRKPNGDDRADTDLAANVDGALVG